jgi:hypothetical protein
MKFYYSSGKVTETPEEPLGIVAILQKDESGQWVITSGGDFYVKQDEFWMEVDIFGLIDHCRDLGIVLEGTMVSNSKFDQIMKQAMGDRRELDNG